MLPVLLLAACDSGAQKSAVPAEIDTTPTQKLDDSFQLIVKGNVTWKGVQSSFDPRNYNAAQQLLREVVGVSEARTPDYVIATNNLAVMLAANGRFSEARESFQRTLQAIDRGVKPDIEPIVLKMAVGNTAVMYTTWLSVLQASGGGKVAYKAVWKGADYPTLFAQNNWYAYEVSDPPALRLRKLVLWNLKESIYLETGKYDDNVK